MTIYEFHVRPAGGAIDGTYRLIEGVLQRVGIQVFIAVPKKLVAIACKQFW